MSYGFIHTASALIDYINDVGFLPLLNVGVAGWSADEAVDEECRYAMRPDGSWEWPLWEWKGEILREGTDIAIIANGLMTYEAIKAGEALEAMGIHARIVNMSTIKPLDEELVLKCAKECGKIITCEEHSIIGGLGEAVCSYLAETCPVPVKRIGVNDKFGCSGTAAEVLKAYGLSAEHIVEVTKAFLNR